MEFKAIFDKGDFEVDNDLLRADWNLNVAIDSDKLVTDAFWD
jgi:hypothetical protein